MGESLKDELEGFTLSRLSDTLISQTYGHDLVQLYERHGDSFRLALIKDRAGNSIAMNFRDGRLIQLVSSAGHVVDLAHDKHGRIVRVSLQNRKPACRCARWRNTNTARSRRWPRTPATCWPPAMKTAKAGATNTSTTC